MKNSNSPSKGAAVMRSTLKELRFDLQETFGNAQRKLSHSEAFAGFDDGIAGMATSPEALERGDPLATQVWRFFSKTKQNLPNQERMENLTWRMMHASLRQQRQADGEESSRYGCLAPCMLGGRKHPRVMQCIDKVLTRRFFCTAPVRTPQVGSPSCENRPN